MRIKVRKVEGINQKFDSDNYTYPWWTTVLAIIGPFIAGAAAYEVCEILMPLIHVS